jgi:hypothetical protein
MRRWRLCLALCASLLAGCGARTDVSLLDGSDAGAGTLDATPGNSDTSVREDGAPVDASSADSPSTDASVVDAPEASSDSPAPCNATTCSQGCCSADGTCVSGKQQNACGAEGQSCQVCPPGTLCQGGGCLQYQANCGPTNCPGCCSGSEFCWVTGRGEYTCGRDGQGCQLCPGQCVAQDGGGGLCNGVQSCNPGNCFGCCAGDVCMAGDLSDQCGNAGEPCHSCGGDLQCGSVANGNGGQCVDGGTCGPGTCPGCCDGLACAYGNQDTACGSHGAACEDCTTDGLTCVANACQ